MVTDGDAASGPYLWVGEALTDGIPLQDAVCESYGVDLCAAAAPEMVTPAAKREAVAHMRTRFAGSGAAGVLGDGGRYMSG